MITEAVLRADYERIRRENPASSLPAWEAMTPEQRDVHRRSCEKLRDYMEKLGAAITSGAADEPGFAERFLKANL